MPLPYDGEQITLHDPDGTELPVRAWGNQFAAVFETLDGYTVMQDPDSGYWHYATLSPDEQELLPTDDRVGAVDPARLDLPRHTRPRREARGALPRAALAAAAERPRWEARRQQRRARSARAAQEGPVPAPPQEETTGDYVGLCLLVAFPDVPATITRQQVDDFCNLAGYAEFGNNGSVRDYFADVSGGKLTYTNVVTAYYTAKHERAYYTDETVEQPLRTWELITEALDDLVAGGFDFSPLTTDDAGFVRALNVFYTGTRVNNWAKGLWPHSWHLEHGYPVTPTAQLYDYQITDLGDRLTLRTFCHENGHMICDYPDLYDYDVDPALQGYGVGHYCLMCFGGSNVNPVQVSAYLKQASGWASSVTPLTPGTTSTLEAGTNDFLVHRRNATEYFVLENRQQVGRDRSLPDAGLVIWHVDELGDNSFEQMTPAQHYECSLEQADGRFDLEHRSNAGDASDLYGAPYATAFGNATTPDSRWWDGDASGLEIESISAPGPKMTVTTADPT
ncbi:M6 family metalloprotease domain-containing protein [Geodermatophilus sp. URMC 62]|uniref:M6 family metalloprotease domain-containing protein n=1 Tax=Geodermatophilus sp. URMC 62 TaxID=3423414 RepID=UPI00406CA160